MGHTYTNLVTHFIFSTKDRVEQLCDSGVREKTFAYMGGIVRELEGVAHRGDFDLRSHQDGKLIKQGDQFVVDSRQPVDRGDSNSPLPPRIEPDAN